MIDVRSIEASVSSPDVYSSPASYSYPPTYNYSSRSDYYRNYSGIHSGPERTFP
jgi:hypothetical protein